MNRMPNSQPGPPFIGTAEVVELWGDGPIFPGPGWRLSWPLANEDQGRINATLKSGQLWDVLKHSFKYLASQPDPWGIHHGRDEQQTTLHLRAVSALASLLLQPAKLDIDHPYTSAQLRTPVLVLRSQQHDLAGTALKLSSALTLAAYLSHRGAQVDLPVLQRPLINLLKKVEICCKHPLTTAQLEEAQQRGIPTFLIDPMQRLYQLGAGVHSCWISSTSNDRDSSFGVTLAKSKDKTHDLLSKLGLPVPRELRLPHNASDGQLIEAADRIGYPCAIKPNNAEQGRGATANIENKSELLEAAQKARQYSHDQILLQEHINGHDHRLNVVHGRLRFAIKRSVPTITGDGKTTILELIQRHNALKRSLRGEDGISTEIDPGNPEVVSMLQKAASTPMSIPRDGEVIQLCRTANISTGGFRKELRAEDIHPKVRKQSEMIARTFRLDICGIDYICQDITLDPDTSRGAFIEVNSMPQNAPSRAIMLIDNLFPRSMLFNIECITIVADWSMADSGKMQARLEEEVSFHNQAVISFPKPLTPTLLPLLSDLNSENIHIHRHPREALLHKTTERLIYLTTPQSVISQGLPTAMPSRVLVWTSQGEPQNNPLWNDFVCRHNSY